MLNFIERYISLIFILTVAFVFRFYNFNEIPFTHDELSALSRLEFNNLSELLKFGVKPDGHPALVQVFMYYWTMLFSNSEQWVKIPFLFCGLASVYLVYKIGFKWFGFSVAVFSSAFIAASQFFIIYSQYSRPYITGCFFALIMIYCLLIVMFEDKVKIKYWFLLGISILLSALNHHISMLAAFVACISALVFIPNHRIKTYLIVCFFSVLAYLPHLPITLSQFSIGGVGAWLSAPENNFILKFLYFLIHYSPMMIGFLIFIFFFNFILVKKSNDALPNKNKIRVFLILNFITVWLICQFYSVFRNPVLQYSTLIFFAPLLIIFLFSFLKETSGFKL
ncbi:MAG: glycosyltransferase family 39 protein, partial [Bacteroidota bacterium]